MTVETEMAAAYRAGQAAARAGEPWDSNPHHGVGDTARERVLSAMWRKGYRQVVDEYLGRTR